MMEEAQLDNLALAQLVHLLKLISATSSQISYGDIYRELNSITNSLSKDALMLTENQLILEEFLDREVISNRDGIFHDL